MPKKYVDNIALGEAVRKTKELLAGKVNVEEGKGLSTNDYTTAEKTKLASLENYTLPMASASTAGGVKIGSGLEIDANGILSATGGGTADSIEWANVQTTPTTLAGYGITDAATQQDILDLYRQDYASTSYVETKLGNLDSKWETAAGNQSEKIATLEGSISTLNSQLTGVYHYKGSVDNLAALEAIENPSEGDVYNIADTGINAAWVVDKTAPNGGYWDQFGTTVDFDNIETMTIAEVDALFE